MVWLRGQFKRLNLLCRSMHARIARFLFSYRITPQTTMGRSPAELLFGCRPRSILDFTHPDTTKQVPKVNRHPIRSFKIGDKLFARNFSGTPLWIRTVVCNVTGPLSYQVETRDGIILKHHSDQLKRHYDNENSTEDSNRDADKCDFLIINEAIPARTVPPPPTSFTYTTSCTRHLSSVNTFNSCGSWTICTWMSPYPDGGR